MMYVNFAIAGNALNSAKSSYYEQTNFADVFAKVKGISDAQVNSLKINGVSDISARVVADSRADVEESDKIVKLRLLSRSYDNINQIIISGNDISEDDDILMNQSYLDAWDLSVGDDVELIVSGKHVTFTVCGTFMSSEYVYIIDDAGAVLPDEATFNVAVVKENVLQGLTVGDGMYNDLLFKLEDGVEFDDVKISLEDDLAEYGLISLTPQKDQLSNSMLTTEINGIVAMGDSVPMVFIGMSIVILYLMLKRIVEQERSQIGVLKAFGYTSTQILISYAFYGMFTGFIGGIAGGLLGYSLSSVYLTVMNQFFAMPNLVRTGTLGYCTTGLIIAVAGGVLGSIMGAKSTLKLQPAESMRPVTPMVTHKIHHGFWENWLSATQQMAFRSISRNKVRSIFIIGGMMFSFAILTFMGSYSSMIDDMMLVQYSKIQTYDGKLGFKTPVFNAQTESERISGVTLAEEIVELPAEMSLANLTKTVVLIGLPQDATMYNIYDVTRKKFFRPPSDGIILTSALADKLDAKIGSYVTINKNQIKVVEIVEQSLGSSAYLEKNYLCDIMDFEADATAVLVQADDMTEIKKIAKESSNILSFDDQATTAKLMQEMMAPYSSLMYLFLIIGIVVAFAIAYNTASIALMERKREYSTLRVIGMHMTEVAGILGFEYWLLGGLGILLGIPLAKLMKIGMAGMVDMEQFYMPTNTPMKAYIVGLICTILAIYLSNLSNVRSVRKMDMVEVLKERE